MRSCACKQSDWPLQQPKMLGKPKQLKQFSKLGEISKGKKKRHTWSNWFRVASCCSFPFWNLHTFSPVRGHCINTRGYFSRSLGAGSSRSQVCWWLGWCQVSRPSCEAPEKAKNDIACSTLSSSEAVQHPQHGWKEDPRSRDDKGTELYKKVLHSLDLTLLWVCGCVDVACMFLFFGRL